MQIAISGASGHIGNNLCRMLAGNKHQIRALSHNFTGSAIDFDAEMIHGDICNPETADRLVAGADVVFHLAAKISINGDKNGEVKRVNVEGTRNITESCLKLGVKRFIHFSSIHSYDPYPLDEVLDESRKAAGVHAFAYDRSKVMADQVVLSAVSRGLDAVILAPTSVIGPNDLYPSLLGQAVLDIARRKIPILVPGGYDFVDVRDVCQSAIAAIERGKNGEKYLLSGHYLSIVELSGIIGEVLQIKTTRRTLPLSILRMLIPWFKWQAYLSSKPPLLTEESLYALTASNPLISSAKAARELGHQPRPIKQTLADTLKSFEKQALL